MKSLKRIKINKRVIEAEECRSIFAKARGLMFRKKSAPLLFVFKKPTRQGIHSFFCAPFLAIWLDKNRIVGKKIVRPFSFSVRPEKEFTHLLEVPLNSRAYAMIADDNRKV